MSCVIHELVVIGAGVSGLALARDLRAAGLAPLVVERSRGVGGRCATRRVEGQPVDHGVAFLHGRDRRFLAELEAVADATALAGWPRVREGKGVACQPKAFAGRDRRLAFREGVSRLPKHLARELDVRLGVEVRSLARAPEPHGAGSTTWALALESGEALRARTVALALPAPSALRLLRTLTPLSAPIAGLLPLLELVRMAPCLAVIAQYPEDAPRPAWDAAYPAKSTVLQTLFQDSTKRPAPARLTLVLQARARFSRLHQDEPTENWSHALLAEAAALHGDWVARPALVQAHCWRAARVAAGCELAAPVVLRLDDGHLLALCGDGFHPAGGVEGAYRSGRTLAARLIPALRP